jgi:DNA-binding CsgD family transcriptional regulator
MIPAHALSETIGLIYDCALEPSRWQMAFAHIARLLDAGGAFLAVIDMNRTDQMRHTVRWGNPDFITDEVMHRFGMTLPGPLIASGSSMALDGIYGTADLMPYDLFLQSKFYREWAAPQGLRDTVAACLMKSGTRFAMASFPIPRITGENDRELLGLLAPHIRRAVTISDAIDMKTVGAHALSETLDRLTLGVLLVAADGRILHGNRAADAMMRTGAPVRSTQGVVGTTSTAATEALLLAIADCAVTDCKMGRRGIGIPAPEANGGPAALHVLPLGRSKVRDTGQLGAVAAVFIVPRAFDKVPAGESMIALYGLTPTEARVAEQIGSGRSREEIAAELGMSENTLKTHLAHVFAKAGVSRQSELARLISEIAVPLGA